MSSSALLYIRVSSDEQAKEGNSLKAQNRLGEKYAADHDLKIVKVFGGSESSKLPGRKQFGQLVDRLEKELNSKSPDRCINLLVEKMDRLSRNDDDIHEIKQLIKKGLKVHLFRHNKVWDSESSAIENFTSDIELATSKYYVANLAQEVQKGMDERIRAGLPHGPAPTGYLNAKDRDGKNVVIIDDVYGPIVKEVFEKCASGNYSLDDLHEFAKERRLMGKKGGIIGRSSIQKFLRSRYYIGEFPCKGEYRKGNYPALVTMDVFKKAQHHLDRRANYGGGPNNKVPKLYQGLMTCYKCGAMITCEKKKGKYMYYHCANPKCDHTCVREEYITEIILTRLEKALPPDPYLEEINTELSSGSGDKVEIAKKKRDHLQREMTKIQRRIDNALDEKLDGLMSSELYMERVIRWEADISNISEVINSIEIEIQELQSNHCIKNILKNGLKEFSNLPVLKKREIIQHMIDEWRLRDKDVFLKLKKPFDIFETAI